MNIACRARGFEPFPFRIGFARRSAGLAVTRG
jgi:hypothetical protein